MSGTMDPLPPLIEQLPSSEVQGYLRFYKRKIKKVGGLRRGGPVWLLFHHTDKKVDSQLPEGGVPRKIHGVEDITVLKFTLFKRRTRPAVCKWNTKCSLCHTSQVVRLNSSSF